MTQYCRPLFVKREFFLPIIAKCLLTGDLFNIVGLYNCCELVLYK